VESFFFMSPHTGHGSQVFEMLSAYSCISWFALFVRGMIQPYFQWARRCRGEAFVSCLGGLALLKSHGAISLWWKGLRIVTALVLNCSAHRGSGKG
jgi:hypothetical protein